MPKLTNKKKLNEWSELYLGNFNAHLGNFLMPEILLARATSPLFLNIIGVILLLGFTTSEMLHRCTTEAFLVQYFLNLILKDNNIVVCFCLMSNALAGSIFKTGGQYYSFIFV